jgi:ABC-type transport system substrate-binding protein
LLVREAKMMSYWQKRISRRRALALSGGGAAAAALLAACGGDSDGGDTRDSAGLVTQPADTTKQAVKGGNLGYFVNADPESFDPFLSGAASVRDANQPIYQRLLRWVTGPADKRPDATFEGDASQSFEITPDGLQVTFKMRAGNKWDQRAPTNGRLITTDDVKFSWEAFAAGANPGAGSMVRARNPTAPIERLEFPDSSTVVVKLASVNSAILTMLAYTWYLSLVPTEAGGGSGGFDRKTEARGSGPFFLSRAQPSATWDYQRNPNYWRTDRPFLDGFSRPVIPDSSQQLAQLKAGRIWYLTPNADLVVGIKREVPQLRMQALSPFTLTGGGSVLNPSKLPNSPFNDVRIRYAMSMLIDRDAYNETFGNIPAFESQGISMEHGWDTHCPVGWPGDWLDPKAGKLGDVSKYWKFNPDEAARLLRAASFFGSEFQYSYIGAGGISTDAYRKQNEVIVAMLSANGALKPRPNLVDSAPYIMRYTLGRGQYEGVAYVPTGGLPDMDMYIHAIYMPGGRNDYVTNKENLGPAFDLAIKHQQELDVKKRHEVAQQWQKAIAEMMPTVPVQGNNEWTQFTLSWPKLGNYLGVVVASTDAVYSTLYENYWYDRSKDTV